MGDPRGAAPLGWPESVLDRLPVPPAVSGAAVCALAFALYAAGSNLAGVWQGLRVDGVFFYDETFGRMGVVVSVLLGYLLAWPRYLARGALRDFDRIRPALRCEAGEADALRGALARLDPAAARRSRAVGALLVPVAPLLMAATSKPGWGIFGAGQWGYGTTWSLLANGLLFWLVGRALYLTGRHGRVFAALAGRLQEPDPLEPDPVLAFGRRGTRAALAWMGGVSISAFLLSNPSFVVPLVPVLVANLACAAFAFLGPVLPIHRRVLRTRRAELERVRAAARRERGTLYEDGPGGRLAALLAWEEHVRAWSTWPFDRPVLLRGALIVLLPVGSWVGGALVEQLVERLLRSGG